MRRRVQRGLVAVGVSLVVGPLPVLPGAAPAAAVATAQPAVPLCGVASMSSVTPPTTAVPQNAVQRGPGGFAVSSLTHANDQLYAVDADNAVVRRFSLDGQPLGSVSLGFRMSSPSVAVDPDGSIYAAQYPDTLVKVSATGQRLWNRPAAVTQEVDGLFAIGRGTSWRLGVVGRNEAEARIVDTTGREVGRNGVRGSAFSTTADGGLVGTDGAYVRRYDDAGRQLAVFGDVRTGNDWAGTGGPLHFYQQGGAAAAPDGAIYVADATRGIHAATPAGFYLGTIPDTTLGHVTHRASVVIANGRLYFAAGGRFNSNQHIAWLSLADAAALRSAPREPTPVLGFGAGLVTGVPANHFRPGQPVTVTARFDAWWATVPSTLTLAYRVRDRHDILRGAWPAERRVTVPRSTAGAAVALTVPPARPGLYEVEARLLADDGRLLGATCLTYTVAAPGDRLDFSSLPPGADYGGAAPGRGVALADVLGTGNLRASVDWTKLLPDPAGAMRFEVYEAAWAAAAREAAARGVAFHVQVAAGTPEEKRMVQDGTWKRRVGELVSHFRGSVRAWEAWNEPNITFGPSTAYTTQVLHPFAEAVRTADPSATVIGGSVVGLDLAYYDGIGAAGGLAAVDVVAIHPYTGHNRSWEEQGTVDALRRLRGVLAKYGAASKPLWITESAWWADGAGNFLAQGDKAARALLWNRVLGIARWHYFLMEGGYGDYGFSYSVIEGTSQPDYVKPGALGLMTAAEATRGRPFTGLVDTRLPHTHVAGFGARPGGTDQLLAAWTDDLTLPAQLVASTSGAVRITDVFGDATTITVSAGQPVALTLSGSPLYVTAPAGMQLEIRAAEAYGPNLALAAGGARATASSSTNANPPSAAIDGHSDALDRGDLVGLPAWASAPGDATPTLSVTLPRPATVNRVLVTGHSIGSIVPGLRTYEVSTRDEAGTWSVAATVRDQFFHRRQLVSFAPRRVTAIRVGVQDINHGGLAGGLRPWFWAAPSGSDDSSPWYGPAVVYELEAFAGTSSPAPAPGTSQATTTTTAPPPSTTTTRPPTTTTAPPATTPTTALPAPPLAFTPAPPARRSGYWMVGAAGDVYAFGDARSFGNLKGHSAVDIEPTRTGSGYWVVSSGGTVGAFGDARWAGNAAALPAGEQVTSVSGAASGLGYWLFTTRGRVLAFGDARHHGDASALRLNGPVLDSVPTPSGNGYYMVASDGGVFTFGDARFHGSTGAIRLNRPVESLVPDSDGEGYWLVASDGGVFAFDAPFRGSTGSLRLNRPVTGMVAFGNGYLMVGEDGGIFNFSDKPFHGSLGSSPPAVPIVNVAALP